jgi:hypothetical protein
LLQDGAVRRSGNFVFLFEGSELKQIWYLDVSQDPVSREQLPDVLGRIQCFGNWRLPKVAELRALGSQSPASPNERPPLPEGLWTSEDDDMGLEWKVYFPSRSEYQFHGESSVWWLAAVTDSTGRDSPKP